MKYSLPALLALPMFLALASCGGSGGSDDARTVFDGHWSGRLTGVSCATHTDVELLAEHDVDADGNGSDYFAHATLVDQSGNEYFGDVILTANSVTQIWGFSVEAVERTDDEPATIFYNVAKYAVDGTAEQADVTADFTISRGDPRAPAGCSYSLTGVFTKR